MGKVYLLNPMINDMDYESNLAEKFRMVGFNTGNLVFSNAVKEQICFDKELWPGSSYQFKAGDKYLFPCANILCASAHWIEYLADIIEKQDAEVVLAGLGAQGEFKDKPKDIVGKLSDKQKRFFKIISERSKSIGVRGEFTAECLGVLGINNIRIIGCPSAYRYMQGNYPKFSDNESTRSLVTIAPGVGKGVKKILRVAMDSHSCWIMQAANEIVEKEVLSWKEVLKRKLFFQVGSLKNIEIYQKNNSKVFFDYLEWNSFLKKGAFGFAFGSRFHGNMMAFRNGIPSLWIVHDMRTLELVKALHLPYISLKEMKGITAIDELKERCDYSDFLKNYTHLLKNYKTFLLENSITSNLEAWEEKCGK